MPVKGSINPAVDHARVAYYKARADKIEMANRLARTRYIEAEKIKELLGRFCDAIDKRVQASDLEPGLKAEIREDLSDYVGRLRSSVARPNGQRNRRQRQRPKTKNGKIKAEMMRAKCPNRRKLTRSAE